MRAKAVAVVSRRSFLAAGAAPTVCAFGQAPAGQASTGKAAASPFSDPDFGFTAELTLAASYYQAGNPGRLLAMLPGIAPGDFEAAWNAYHDAGAEARTLAERAAAKRHRVSAREAYLWAANYFRSALRLGDGTKYPERLLPCWKEYAACWSAAAGLFDPPAERLEIPYEGTSLTGWFLRADRAARRRPLVIFNNGADGLEISMYVLGAAGALARGYNCLIFNGPGQGDSLWVRGLHFRPDWENVIRPVVDFAVRHPEVDPKRIALVGASLGGYWVPRALAFERRIAAGVADPGVWDAAEPFVRKFPPFLMDMLRNGQEEAFNEVLKNALAQDARAASMMRFRMRPFGTASYYEQYRAVQQYSLAEVAGQITCPMLITDPEGETFFPGQAKKLYDALHCPKTLARFTHAEGAGAHCEEGAPGYRDYVIYDWLDEVFS